MTNKINVLIEILGTDSAYRDERAWAVIDESFLLIKKSAEVSGIKLGGV